MTLGTLKELNFVRGHLTEQDMLIQFAEECTEAAQAALKKSRCIAGNNPSRKSYEECDADLIEEFTDVCISAAALGIKPDAEITNSKIKRWASIVGGANEKEGQGT